MKRFIIALTVLIIPVGATVVVAQPASACTMRVVYYMYTNAGVLRTYDYSVYRYAVSQGIPTSYQWRCE